MSGTFSGVNTLQFSPDNKHAYAYSGTNLSTTGITDVPMIVQTQSFYLIGKIMYQGNFNIANSGGTRGYCQVFFNDVMVGQILNDYDTGNMMQGAFMDVIIPPFTTVTFKQGADSASSSLHYTVNAMFKVKGAIEQFDLEVNE
jgi:hypothetical protein